MKFNRTLLAVIVIAIFSFACFDDADDNGIFTSEINNFVWKGLNVIYLYKDNVPNLANDRFSNNEDYGSYLNSFSAPEELFESLIYQRQSVDKFSWIVDDYIALEQSLSGVFTSNGMEYTLFLQPNSSTALIGVVRLVLPNSDADNKGLKRGDMFNAINGTPLTNTNSRSLLAASEYILNLATYNNNGTPESTDDTVDSTTESISLSKLTYSENPIFKSEILSVDGENVGYLMYNGFTNEYDSQLNEAFGTFLANNVQHLVLDLRYNPGGSVNTAILLSSMITGQNTGEVFSSEQWNSEFQTAFENENPELLINRFTNNNNGNPLNSLNLQKVYILATKRSASASEQVINSLDPYIDVIHIGENTYGKYQASLTIYDSQNFGREGANPNHSYAMQPLVLKSLNSVGHTDYDNGLIPDIPLSENYTNLGVLGDENETLLAAALADIASETGRIVEIQAKSKNNLILVKDSNSLEHINHDMYIEKELPKDLINRILFEQD